MPSRWKGFQHGTLKPNDLVQPQVLARDAALHDMSCLQATHVPLLEHMLAKVSRAA